MKKIILLTALILSVTIMTAQEKETVREDDASGFVLITDIIPEVLLEIRYYSAFNFVGKRIDGYEEPIALVTKEAAAALKAVSDKMIEKGYLSSNRKRNSVRRTEPNG